MKIKLPTISKRTLLILMVIISGLSLVFLIPGIVKTAQKDPYDEKGVLITEIPIYGALTHFHRWEPSVVLSGCIVQPLFDDGRLRPGVVICHGWGATKEELIYVAADLARAGIVCLLFDMEGTGRSTGAHNFIGGRTRLNAWAAFEYLVKLSGVLRINTSCMGMMGHSQGGLTTAIAAALDEVSGPASLGIANISASISIFISATTDDIFGSIFGYDSSIMSKMWPYIGMPMFDLNNPLERMELSVIPKINASRPKNWMVITGQNDQITENWMQYYVMKEAVPSAITYEDLISNLTLRNVWTLPSNLGNFSSGTARKMSLLYGRDHGGERDSILSGTMIIDWFYNAFSYKTHKSDLDILIGIMLFRDEMLSDFDTRTPFQVMFDTLGGNGMLIGLTILMIPLSFVLSKIFRPAKKIIPENAKTMDDSTFKKQLLIYGCVYLIASLCAFLFAALFQIYNVVPFFITNFFALGFLMKQIILVPCFCCIMYYESKKYNQTAEDFGVSPKSFLSSALIGLILVVSFIFITNIVDLSFNHYTIALFFPPSHLTGFFSLLLILGLNFFMDDLIFRGLVQSKMERYGGSWNGLFYSNFYTALIGGLSMFLLFLPIFWNDLGAHFTIWDPDILKDLIIFGNSPIHLSIIIITLLGGAGIYALIGIISGTFRAKTKNIIAGTIVITIMAAFLMVNWRPLGMVTSYSGVFFREYFPII
ncbi:MAG: alpha/beta hydrolase [Candidatus Helarchaeota archaeon]